MNDTIFIARTFETLIMQASKKIIYQINNELSQFPGNHFKARWLDIQHNKKDAGIKQLMSDCMFGNIEAVDKKSTIHREIQDNDKSLTTSGGSANILMKNLACISKVHNLVARILLLAMVKENETRLIPYLFCSSARHKKICCDHARLHRMYT